ncbi:MAG TPA: hypothetical protein VG244_05880 [Acidimicrobiales bacterium]|jgi:hypothetical protein|nr:hypothetical protein [Acidimicrobiales bacterium]
MNEETHAGRRGPSRGRRRSATAPPSGPEQERLIGAWFAGRVPVDWYEGSPKIAIDGDEIQVVGALASPQLPVGTPEDEVKVAEQARIAGFREDSRGARMQIADEAQPAFRRAVSWGAQCGDTTVLFTTTGVPVMTRLRMADRGVLDTLIDAGVARSRSEALAWCVRLVAQHEEEWIEELRAAMTAVEEVRNRGPKSAGGAG